MTQPPTPADGRRLTITEKLLTVFSAVLALITAFLVLQTAIISKAKEEAQSAAATKGTDLSSLQAQYDQLKSQNSALESENAQLRSELGLPGPTAATQQPAGSTVRHSGQLVLAVGGDAADLDSPKSDLQWKGKTNEFYSLGNLGNADLGYDGKNILFGQNGNSLLYLGATRADYDTCSSRTGYSNRGSIEKGDIQSGDWICIKTNERRYSAVRLVQIGSTNATFDIVTYDPPSA